MTHRDYAAITRELDGWRPSAEAQLIIFWRILHLFMSRYGSIPAGQMLVGLTTITLNDFRYAPTVGDLCEATGLPKSSISRYIAAQMEQGVIQEKIDPADRRRRRLVPTDVGRKERRWQIKQMSEILADVRAWDEKNRHDHVDALAELEAMKQVTACAPPPFERRRRSESA